LLDAGPVNRAWIVEIAASPPGERQVRAVAVKIIQRKLHGLAGEFLERCLFFRVVDAPKMPGVPA